MRWAHPTIPPFLLGLEQLTSFSTIFMHGCAGPADRLTGASLSAALSIGSVLG
jgi:hypothetical protein